MKELEEIHEADIVNETQHSTALANPLLGPQQQVDMATQAANVLTGVIEKQKLYSMIQGKKYVKVEGWTTLAALKGCTPRERECYMMGDRFPEQYAKGDDRYGVFVSTVELINADGRVLGVASAECGDPDELDRKGEPVWANRASYARRSMANTRATSKVCRQVFSWVMVLAGFQPTPEEEMSPVEAARKAKQAKSPPKTAPSPKADPENAHERPSEPASEPFDRPWDGQLKVRSGKHAGKMWCELETGFLEWAIKKDGAIQEMAAKELARRAVADDEPDDGGFEWVDDEPGARG